MTSPYPGRRRRAVALLDAQAHAEELLGFYIALLELQESIWREAGVEGSPLAPSAMDERRTFGLADLAPEALEPPFARFLDRLGRVATPDAVDTISRLVAAPVSERTVLLEASLKESGAELAQAADVELASAHLLARAFVQPIAERLLSARIEHVVEDAHLCPSCGRPPQVGVVMDVDDAKGRRYLVCSLCATWWAFPRACCAACGESASDRLVHHVDATLRHVRVDECQRCARYLKTVDLRVVGDAVPLVDELATVELDLWAAEHGLAKIRVNVAGL